MQTQPSETFKLKLFYSKCIQNVAKLLQSRQQVASTAITYFRKFYSKNHISNSFPELVAITCLYLATKTEEAPLFIKNILSEFKQQIKPNLLIYDVADVSEFEFYLLEFLDCMTIVESPHRLLQSMIPTDFDAILVQKAWNIINDAYLSDICINYDAKLIAVTALQMALNTTGTRYCEELIKIGAKVEWIQVVELTQDFIESFAMINSS